MLGDVLDSATFRWQVRGVVVGITDAGIGQPARRGGGTSRRGVGELCGIKASLSCRSMRGPPPLRSLSTILRRVYSLWRGRHRGAKEARNIYA